MNATRRDKIARQLTRIEGEIEGMVTVTEGLAPSITRHLKAAQIAVMAAGNLVRKAAVDAKP